MKFIELRQKVLEKIKEELPDLKEVSLHPGRFNLDELKRIGTKAPAVYVSLMGTPTVKRIETGENEVYIRLAAFIVTRDERKLPKDEAALAIVESLLVVIPCQRWGLKNTSDAVNVKADNLFNGSIERKGVAMWAITWEQTLRIGEDVWGGGVLPSEVYVSEDPDNENEEDYERMA
ncbi:hypothetical protein IMCC1989_1152 [gamma proteobacterium IMCC1989]|nr:hypothetical protein IMCC1989_1152 [gamma proteobacterium IMCC1989]